jgi:hypothetical protein
VAISEKEERNFHFFFRLKNNNTRSGHQQFPNAVIITGNSTPNTHSSQPTLVGWSGEKKQE